jgi:hypothetical protein
MHNVAGCLIDGLHAEMRPLIDLLLFKSAPKSCPTDVTLFSLCSARPAFESKGLAAMVDSF